MEHPIQVDDSGVALFQETSIYHAYHIHYRYRVCVYLLWCSIYHVLAYYIIYILLILMISVELLVAMATEHVHVELNLYKLEVFGRSIAIDRLADSMLHGIVILCQFFFCPGWPIGPSLYDACEMVDRYLGGKYLKSIGQYLEGKRVSTTFPTGFPWSSMRCLGFIWTLRNTKTSVFPAEICSEQGNFAGSLPHVWAMRHHKLPV